jgi:UDP-N-acetylglucosamine 2-epimerase (non-hydrolysing)
VSLVKSPRIKVLAVFGTRPEAIKMAPLILGMRAQPKYFVPVVCVTGQHRQMLQQVLQTFGIEPEHDLAVMRRNQTLASMSARILKGVDAVIAEERPDAVMVQGDTTTAFVAALAGFYRNVPVAHIEAGLRTGDFANPFPEELNRVLIDRFARWCFAPTELNRRTLLNEHVAPDHVHVTGNTGIDALLFIRDRVSKSNNGAWRKLWADADAVIQDRSRPLVLITAHRRESFGPRLRAIFTAIRNLARRHKTWSFVFPVHLNPNVTGPAQSILSGLDNVHLIKPLAYEPFVFLMDRASLILTDSGGVQEEAPSLGKPVIVMRETTERQEALRAGTVMLAGNSGLGLESAVEKLMQSAGRARPRPNPYGDGQATRRILDVLRKELARK